LDDEDDGATPLLSRPRRWLRIAKFLASMAAIGITMALAWDYSGLRAAYGDLGWLPLSSLSSQGASKPQPEDQIVRVTRELEALKKGVSDLSAGVQQIAVSNAALQTGQQELRQRISALPASSNWYSDPTALQLRFAIPHRPAPASAPRAAPPE